MSAPLDGSISEWRKPSARAAPLDRRLTTPLVAVEFLHARPESEAQELVSELGGESRRGVSKTTTHYVTDQSNVSQLARATRLGVHCVTIDWLLQCVNLVCAARCSLSLLDARKANDLLLSSRI
jgi:hypothetical protein